MAKKKAVIPESSDEDAGPPSPTPQAPAKKSQATATRAPSSRRKVLTEGKTQIGLCRLLIAENNAREALERQIKRHQSQLKTLQNRDVDDESDEVYNKKEAQLGKLQDTLPVLQQKLASMQPPLEPEDPATDEPEFEPESEDEFDVTLAEAYSLPSSTIQFSNSVSCPALLVFFPEIIITRSVRPKLSMTPADGPPR
ncbi:hypothetical protein OF83DRAFT_1087449 [Amylostereum chailletii]|nr:hypothetical protein OF83DRAFT_1087449 [Amylostereum chailletii]